MKTIRTIGSCIIGFITAIMGYPVYSFKTHTFEFANMIILAGLIFVWCMFCQYLISDTEN